MEPYSVLMSVYAAEKAPWFRRSLDSMVNQTVPPAQIVLISDGPLTQPLEDVIDDFQRDHRGLLDVIRLPENRGLGLALQTGLQSCRYDLVARMDTDDIALPDRMEKQLRVMEKHPEFHVLGGQIAEFSGDPENIIGYRKVPLAPEEISRRVRVRNPMNHMTVLMRKSSILDAGSYQHLKGFEDYHLWIRVIAAGGQLANLPDVCCYVRVDEKLYARRGGWKYFCDTMKIEKLLLENKMVSRGGFCRNLAVRFVGTVVVPNKLRGYLFRTVLRKQSLENGKVSGGQ